MPLVEQTITLRIKYDPDIYSNPAIWHWASNLDLDDTGSVEVLSSTAPVPVKPVAVTLHRPGDPKQLVIERFDTIKEAEDYITVLLDDPTKRADVEAGHYGVDAPEGFRD